ncbi:hypothetical protein C8J56DRAFT_1058732 [Mycena floridula]|nr:hypothetical protein C8J56DRAFT_1058732 [Mycena floridula]
MVRLDDLPQELWIKVAVEVEHDSHLAHWLSVDPFSSARHMHDVAFELLFRDSCITFLTRQELFDKSYHQVTSKALFNCIGPSSLQLETLELSHVTPIQATMSSLGGSILFPRLTTLIVDLQCNDLTGWEDQRDSLGFFLLRHSQSLTTLNIEPDFYIHQIPDDEDSREAFDAY